MQTETPPSDISACTLPVSHCAVHGKGVALPSRGLHALGRLGAALAPAEVGHHEHWPGFPAPPDAHVINWFLSDRSTNVENEANAGAGYECEVEDDADDDGVVMRSTMAMFAALPMACARLMRLSVSQWVMRLAMARLRR